MKPVGKTMAWALAAFLAGVTIDRWVLPQLSSPSRHISIVASGERATGNAKAAPQNAAWNPKGSLAEIIKSTHGGPRLQALCQLVEATPVSDLARLLNDAAGCPQAEVRQLVSDLAMSKWVQADPRAAVAFAYAKVLQSSKSSPLLITAFDTWAGADPRAAFAAASTLDRLSLRNTALGEVLATWAQSGDPGGAIAAAQNLPAGQASDNALRQIFDRWSQADAEAAYAALGQINNARLRAILANTTLANMAASDPALAVKMMRELPVGQQTAMLFRNVFTPWASQDPAAAFAALGSFPLGPARTGATLSVFDAWTQLDPAGALAALQTLPMSAERQSVQEDVLNVLATREPAAASDFLLSIPAGAYRNTLIGSFLNSWSDTDPVGALAWLKANSKEAGYDNKGMGPFLAKLSAADSATALAFVAQLPNDSNRQSYFGVVLGEYAKTDPASTITWLNNNLTGKEHDAVLANVVNQLTATDPAAVAAYYNQMPPGAARDNIAATIAFSLATQDTKAALDFVQNLPADTPEVVRNKALQNALGAWANADPAAAADYLQNLADNPTLTNTFGAVARALAQNDTKAALAWAEALPTGAARNGALASALGSLAKFDGPSALEYSFNLPQNNNTSLTQRAIIAAWSLTDPASAAAAALALDNPSTRVNAIVALTDNWVQQDPKAVSEWMQTIPPGEERDAAVARYLSSEAYLDPPGSYAMALTIGNDLRRYNQVRNSIVPWAQLDPVAAKAALEAAPITDQQRSLIRNALNSNAVSAASGSN